MPFNARRPATSPRGRGRARLLGWWYVCIGAAFFLLGVQRLVIGESRLLVALRWLIAAGFLLLGWFELRVRRAGR